MILNNLKWITATLLILLAISKIANTANIPCTTDPTNDCAQLGEYAECVNGTCRCSEFFVLSDDESSCLKIVSHGKSCREYTQCQGYMGNDALCAKGKCACFSPLTNNTILDPTGKCIQPKKLGEPCSTDSQCIYGNGTTNALARCLNKVCGCHMDHAIGLHTEDVDGICMVPAHEAAEECSVVDISLLAIMVAGSAVVLLFIYVMFRIATKDRKKNTTNNKTANFNPQHAHHHHHDGIKMEHDGIEH